MMAGLAMKGDAPGTPRREIAYLSVSPNLVAGVGARIVAGRDLSPIDTFNAPRAVVINETLARQFWPAGDAIGKVVQIVRMIPMTAGSRLLASWPTCAVTA